MTSGRFTALHAALLLAAACSPAPPDPVVPVASVTAAPTAILDGTPDQTDDELRLALVDPLARGMTVEGVTALCDDNLAIANKMLAAIRARVGRPPSELSFENTLGRLDDAFLAINDASEFPYLMGVAHPSEAVRTAARACEGKTDALLTSLWLDTSLANVLKAYGKKKEQLSPERQRFLEHTLRDFRRNGLDLPPDKQQRLREINAEVTELGQSFIAAIGASVGKIEIPPASLTGLSDAYKKAHPPGPNGRVTITTDYPDYYPFVSHSHDRESARELDVKFVNRGGDDNVARLDRLLALRHEKAQMLGYATWADYAIEPRMARSAAEVRAFLERVAGAIAPAVQNELKDFRGEFQRFGMKPNRPMTPADRYFLTERLKQRTFQLDSNELANYFEVEAVTKGLLSITATMYGIEYRQVPAEAWHESVRAYEVWEKGRLVGKFFLDLHSRDSKYKHAAMFVVRSPKRLSRPAEGEGVVQTPMATLLCNFPNPGEPMPHDQVVTYFHEFGHVLHHLLSDTELASFAGTNTVRDFVEAPSQMFEEWPWSREVLDLFARHRDSGEKIPDRLFQAMAKSRRLGLALATERQIFLALLDLAYHTTPPGFDSTKLLEEIHNKHFSFAYVKGTHFQSSFGHLIGYDAGYYGYQWAAVLAYDVLSRFQKEGLLNPAPAADWRHKVLARGGSYDERAMIREFLGREPSEQAYVEWLRGP